MLARDGAWIGAVENHEMLLQVVAFSLVEGLFRAEPELATAFRRGLDAEPGMACGEIQGCSWNQIIEEHDRPGRSTCRPSIDVGFSRILEPRPRQDLGEIDEREGVLPEPGRADTVGTRPWTTHCEIDTIDTDVPPPGDHAVGMVAGFHKDLTLTARVFRVAGRR